MTDDDFWSTYVPLRLPPVLPTWRPLPGTRKPLRLVEPDLDSYDECFRGFRFWEIAPTEEEVLVDHPNLHQEPACEIKELKLVGAEARKRKLACWLVWFSSQPSDRKSHLASKGRDLGRTYLSEIDGLEALASDTAPRLPVRSGTMLLGASPEKLKEINEHWRQMELRWLAWHAQQENYNDERCEAVAWNTAISLFAAFGQTYPQREVIKHSFQDGVVETEGAKSELRKRMVARGIHPRSLLSRINERSSPASSINAMKAPRSLITIEEFKVKNSEWVESLESNS
ncbi:MAG: hypothetical protein ABJ388_00360 [Alphaproteobacteria bacterium]|uniref:hypothetical protein n=1 Tax=Nisaea sp. TaxID=2024842 RepID=UPI003266C766